MSGALAGTGRGRRRRAALPCQAAHRRREILLRWLGPLCPKAGGGGSRDAATAREAARARRRTSCFRTTPLPHADRTGSVAGCLAERVGFEPTVRSRAQRFSRPPRSATLAPLPRGAYRTTLDRRATAPDRDPWLPPTHEPDSVGGVPTQRSFDRAACQAQYAHCPKPRSLTWPGSPPRSSKSRWAQRSTATPAPKPRSNAGRRARTGRGLSGLRAGPETPDRGTRADHHVIVARPTG